MPPPDTSIPEDSDPFERFRRGSRYTIGRELGAGGMGAVYFATDNRLNRPVAIKILHPHRTTPAARRRFAREARLLAKLHHPNIVTVHDAGEGEGVWYFVMDYIDSPTLAERLVDGPLPIEGVRALGSDLLQALEAAHRAGVIHRDVKPANVFVTAERALLADFGIASVKDPTDPEDTSLTTPGQQLGTPAYMAPDKAPSFQTDIYGVGLLLYEACTGQRWAPGMDPVAGDWSRVPHGFRPALKRALAISPDKRWQNAGSFRRALERRPVPILVPAAMAAVMALALWYILRPQPPNPSCLDTRTDFAILPFTAGGVDNPTGFRLARYAGNQLESFPRWKLTSVPASFAWSAVTQPDQRVAEAPGALRARYFADGELLNGTRSVQLAMRNSCGEPYHSLVVPGDSADLLTWGSAIADSVVRIIFPRYLDEFRDLATQTGRNYDAYNELFAGQDAFRLDDWANAEGHYLKALELDPTFAQAAWELAFVRRWRERSLGPEWQQLYEQRDRLSALQQLILAAQRDPDLPARFGKLEAAVRQYPHNPEGILLDADELYHRGPLAGVALDSALRVWEAATRLQPYFTAYVHMAVGQIRLGNRAAASQALDALRHDRDATNAEAQQRASLLGLVFDQRFRPWRAWIALSFLDWRADSAAAVRLSQYTRLGLVFDVPEAQRRVGRILVRRSRDPAVQANGHEAQGLALMAQGRPMQAIVQFDSAAALFGTPDAELERAEWRLLPAALGLPASDTAARKWARHTLAAAADGPGAARAAWALAVDAEASGDSEDFTRWRDRLIALPPDSSGSHRLGRLLDALRRAGAGDRAGALAITDSLLTYDGGSLTLAPFARALLYLRRGEWLAAEGMPERADRAWEWYEGWDIDGWAQRGAQSGEVDAVASVIARLRRAELAARRGDLATACDFTTRVRELWSQAEPSYQALLGRARTVGAACRG